MVPANSNPHSSAAAEVPGNADDMSSLGLAAEQRSDPAASGPLWFRKLGSGWSAVLVTGFAATLTQYAAAAMTGLELVPGSRAWSSGGLVALVGGLWIWKRFPTWEGFKRAIWAPVLLVSLFASLLIGQQGSRLQAQGEGGSVTVEATAAAGQGQTEHTAIEWWDRGYFDTMAYAQGPDDMKVDYATAAELCDGAREYITSAIVGTSQRVPTEFAEDWWRGCVDFAKNTDSWRIGKGGPGTGWCRPTLSQSALEARGCITGVPGRFDK